MEGILHSSNPLRFERSATNPTAKGGVGCLLGRTMKQTLSRILVVDDSPGARERTRSALEDGDFLVVEASSGPQALLRAAEVKPRAVVTDLNMPGMDGLQLVAKLRQRGIHCPVLMVTAETSPQLRSAGIRLGVSAWLHKPFDAAHLTRALEAILKHDAVSVSPTTRPLNKR